MHETWGLFYSRAMRTLPTSCHMLPHMQYRHVRIVRRMRTGKLAALITCGVPGFTYEHAIHAGQMIFIKIIRLTF